MSRVALLAVVLAAFAPVKEGARARLLTPLALDAAPGATVRVAWSVDVPDGSGGRRPFGASDMFVRLLSRTGGPSTVGFAASAGGRNRATVVVPRGGIGGVRVGLRGTRCDAAGCRNGDLVFPLVNDPFVSPGGVRCDAAALAATLRAFARAYNSGDLTALDRLFSRERFVWYSSGEPGVRLLPEAEKRETLVAYFREQHRRGDRVAGLRFRFNGRRRDVGDFELSAQRRADGFRGGRWTRVLGKGALDCSAPPVTIAALSIGAAVG